MSEPILSILIATIDERHEEMQRLYAELSEQIGHSPVEIIVLLDNKSRTIGEKRTSLLQIAKGKYVSAIDDDDDISEDFIEEIIKGIETDADVITFKQQASLDGETFIVDFGYEYINEGHARDDEGKFVNIKRQPFQMCAWKRELVKDCVFPSVNYGEDAGWVECAVSKVKTEHHIDKVLHYYNFSSEKTRAV